MAAATPVQPQYPGGWELAPEITAGGGCAHPPCSCAVDPGRRYCCRACRRAAAESADCACGHAGCTARAF